MFFQDTLQRLHPVVCPHRGTTFYFLPPQVALSLCSRATTGGQTIRGILRRFFSGIWWIVYCRPHGLLFSFEHLCCCRVAGDLSSDLSGQDKHRVTTCVQKKNKNPPLWLQTTEFLVSSPPNTLLRLIFTMFQYTR